MNSDEKIWYSFSGKPYHGSIPAFPGGEDFLWLKEWNQKRDEIFPVLLREISSYLESEGQSLETYFNRSLVSGEGQWKVGFFYRWGKRDDVRCAKCPQLAAWLKTVPGLLSAAVSVLPAGTEILPHIGDTNTVARCHLGLKIPASLPECGIMVDNEKRSWREGEWLIFCDAYTHSTWNKTSSPRYVLIIDVLWPEFKKDEKKICSDVISLLKLQALEQKRSWVKNLPGFVRGLIRRFYTFTS